VLCTAACIPETINDLSQQKHRLIKVWFGLQQTAVDKATDEVKRSLWAYSRMKGHQLEDLL